MRLVGVELQVQGRILALIVCSFYSTYMYMLLAIVIALSLPKSNFPSHSTSVANFRWAYMYFRAKLLVLSTRFAWLQGYSSLEMW